MITTLLLLTSVVIILFGFVVLFGAPYLPTLKNRTNDAFALLDLQPGQTMVELGSGDGRMLIESANRGIYAIGYELNPLLVVYTWLRTLRYRKFVKVYWRNYWHTTLPSTDAVYVFLLDSYMEKLDKKIIQEISRPIKLVSFAFKLPGRKIKREQGGMYLYCLNPEKN